MMTATQTQTDNSFGLGYYPLPAKLSGLGRFVANLAPKKLVSHKVFVEKDGLTHMLTAKVDLQFSIMVLDMQSLINHGLIRVQCNDPGTMAFYFKA